jgi:hypothetical protein
VASLDDVPIAAPLERTAQLFAGEEPAIGAFFINDQDLDLVHFNPGARMECITTGKL